MTFADVVSGLPSIGGSYPLSEEDRAAFERDGHVKLRGVLSSDEIAAYRPHLQRVVDEHAAGDHSMEQRVAGSGKNWKFVNNLWALDDVTRQFVLNPRLACLASGLLGGGVAVRLFRDQSYFKGPGGANTPWHQDAYFMPLDTDRILTMWIPLTAIDPELAPMSYVSGSHKHGYLGTSTGDDTSMDAFEAEMRAKKFTIWNYGHFDVGDIAVHSAWTLHSSRTNTSPRMREAVVIVYFADGAHLVVDPALAPGSPPQEYFAALIRRENRQTSLPGLADGDRAAGPMAPLVFAPDPN